VKLSCRSVTVSECHSEYFWRHVTQLGSITNHLITQHKQQPCCKFSRVLSLHWNVLSNKLWLCHTEHSTHFTWNISQVPVLAVLKLSSILLKSILHINGTVYSYKYCFYTQQVISSAFSCRQWEILFVVSNLFFSPYLNVRCWRDGTIVF